MLGKSRLQAQIQDYRKGLSIQMQEQSVHGRGQREGRLFPRILSDSDKISALTLEERLILWL